MANDVIDISVHGTKVGVGTIAGNTAFAPDARHVALNFSGAGNIVNIPLGNEPLHIKVVNVTDVIVWEWFRGMPATNTVKTVTAGTTTIDATSAITVTGDNLNGNWTANLSAALAASAKVLVIEIDL